MTILTKEFRVETSADPFDQALLAGFVTPGVDLPHGERKIVLARLRARIAAVEAWVSTGERLSHQALAERVGMSDGAFRTSSRTRAACTRFRHRN